MGDISENLVAISFPHSMEMLVSIDEASKLLDTLKTAVGIKVDYNNNLTDLDIPIKQLNFRYVSKKEIEDFNVKQLLKVDNE